MKKQKSELRLQLEKMEIGDILKFPKENRNKISCIITKLMYKDRYYIIRSVRGDDVLSVKRLE